MYGLGATVQLILMLLILIFQNEPTVFGLMTTSLDTGQSVETK